MNWSKFLTWRMSIWDPGKKASTPNRSTTDSAFDAALQLAGDSRPGIVGFLYVVPDAHEIGLLLGKDDLAFLVFDVLEKDLDLLADFDVFGITEFLDGDDAL